MKGLLPRLHTTAMGSVRVSRNLDLADGTDVTAFCRRLIEDERCQVRRQGKNLYFSCDGIEITVHAGSETIITAHRVRDGSAAGAGRDG